MKTTTNTPDTPFHLKPPFTKEDWLLANNYLTRDKNHKYALTFLGAAVSGRIDVNTLLNEYDQNGTISNQLWEQMIQGNHELQAKYNTTDLMEIIYQEALRHEGLVPDGPQSTENDITPEQIINNIEPPEDQNHA